MNAYDRLVGQSFTRNGTCYTIVKCAGATVLATMRRGGQAERVMVPLAEVLDAMDVPEVTVTELPSEIRDQPRRRIG